MFDAQGNRKYLNEKERASFFKAACRMNDNAEKSFCLVMYYTGCRISEALNLRANSIDTEEKQIVFRTLKQRGNRKFRAVPVPSDFLIMLPKVREKQRLWAISRTTGWRTVKNCMKEAKLEGVKATPKGLRHGFAVACISKDIPVTVVQRWLGHENLKNTAVYLEVGGVEDRKFAKRLWK